MAFPFQSIRDIPADLLPDILSRLPVKSLLRFRCASKTWQALVDSDADFAQMHLKNFKNNSDQTPLFVVQTMGVQTMGDEKRDVQVRDSETFEPILSLPEEHMSGYWITSYPIDGLILLKSATKRVNQFRDLKVWNPSIRKLLEIPPFHEPELSSPDNSVTDEDIGIGYDPVTKDYKLVKLIYVNHSLHSLAIYILGADSWKIINTQVSNWHWDVYGFDQVIYFQGSLYFIAIDSQKDGVWDLVWFDLRKEEFSSISLPDDPIMRSSHYEWKSLVLVPGGFAVEAYRGDFTDIYLWAADCWIKPPAYSVKDCVIFHIKKNGDLLMRITDYVPHEHVVWKEFRSYNCQTKEHKTLQRRYDIYVSHVSCYVESLILHNLNR